MNDLERRLQDAAAEVRQLARRSTRAPVDRSSRTSRGVLVLAAAFAVVAITFGLIPLLAGSMTDRSTPTGTPTTPGPEPTTTVVTPDSTTTPTTLPVGCSATGVDVPGAVEGLPAAVSDTRRAIIDAASSCNLDELQAIASDPFNTSFGGGGFANLREWEAKGSGQLGTLLKVLASTHGVIEGDGGDIYVWPAAFAYETWNEIPDPLMEELLSIHSEAEIERMAMFGSYTGWRVGITETGEWEFFVAGD